MCAATSKPVSLLKKGDTSDKPSAAASSVASPAAAPAAPKVDSLALLMTRNIFYTNQASRALTIVLTQAGLILVLLFTLIELLSFTNSRDYFFPVNNDNTLIIERPLSDPLFTDEQLLDWATKAVIETMTFGYYDHLMRLQDARNYFTTLGWAQFTQAIDEVGLLATIDATESATIKGVKQVINSRLRPGQKAVIVKQGNAYGQHYWLVRMNIDVNFLRLSAQTSVPWDVEIGIVRLPANESREGIGIQSLLAKRG